MNVSGLNNSCFLRIFAITLDLQSTYIICNLSAEIPVSLEAGKYLVGQRKLLIQKSNTSEFSQAF